MLRFVLEKSDEEDDDLTLMIDESGLETLLAVIQAARRTGHEHLIENEFISGVGLTNDGEPSALKHVLVDWCGTESFG